MEEAQAIAIDYIQSLDNLPAEVHHLLAEIRIKENKISEMQAHMGPKMAAYLRHATRTGGLTPKDAGMPDKIAQDHEKIAQLADEKLACATRIVQLLTRAIGRLDVDLARALDRSGETPQDLMMGGSRTAIERLPDSLRSALSGQGLDIMTGGGALGLSTSGTSTPHPPMKRRRMNSMAPSPAAGADGHLPAGRSRLSLAFPRQPSPTPRSRRATSELVKDADAEGEEEEEEEEGDDPSGDPEDKTLYCLCQSLSYGKMIGCDNDSCPYQWFHLTCVGLQDPLPKQWFCPPCLEKHGSALTNGSGNTGGGGSNTDRRRRRK